MVLDGAATDVAFSPDGRHLASACSEMTPEPRAVVVILPAEGGRIVHRLSHPNGINSVVYSPDGRRIVTCCQDSVARIWDSASGRLLAQTPSYSGGGIGSVDVSLDGTMFATGKSGRGARVWDMGSGSPVTAWLKHEQEVTKTCLTPDGQHLLTTAARQLVGEIRLWNLAPNVLPVEELEKAVQALGGCRFEAARGPAPLPPEAVLAIWKAQRLKGHEPFVASELDIMRWHQWRATVFEQRLEWSAARFHLQQMKRLQPNDAEVAERYARVEAEWSKVNQQ
jgi:hypothetical protein